MTTPAPQTIAVTGATGFVGRYTVRELTRRGIRVRALARSTEKAQKVLGKPSELRSMGIDLVIGDVCDAGALDELVRGCTAAIHLVGIIREVRGQTRKDLPQSFERMHIRATQAMVDACKRNTVGRLSHLSALGVGPNGRSEYQRTKWQAEQIVRRAGLDWTIFRPSLIHGAESELIRMLSDMASGQVAPYFFIPYFVRIETDQRVPLGPMQMIPAKVQPVAVEDVAYALVEAIERPDSIGEIYNLVGPETLDWRELSEVVRDTLPSANKKMGTWFVPGEHAALIAQGAELLGLGGLLPFDRGQALMAIEDSTADPTKAMLDLGLEPRPFRATLRQYASRV